jgi:hypothetical protein
MRADREIADEFLKLDARATCRNNLGEALELGRRPAEAEAIFRQALGDYRTLADRFPDDVDYRWGVAMALTNLAAVVDHQGRPVEAIGPVEEAAKLFADLSAKLSKNEAFQGHRSKNEQLRERIRRRRDASRP